MQVNTIQQQTANPLDGSVSSTLLQPTPLTTDVTGVTRSQTSTLSTEGEEPTSSGEQGGEIRVEQAGPGESSIAIESVVRTTDTATPTETTNVVVEPSTTTPTETPITPTETPTETPIETPVTTPIDTPTVDVAQVPPTTGNTFDIGQNGETAVTLSQDLVTALGTLNVEASGFGGTDISDGIAEFDIVGGAADVSSTKVDLLHSGGLTFTAGETTVNLTDFVIDNLEGDGTTLTGLVTLNGNLVTRAPLFDLTISSVVPPEGESQTLKLEGIEVALTGEAAGVLNDAFDVTAFNSGLNIGTATSEIPLETDPQPAVPEATPGDLDINLTDPVIPTTSDPVTPTTPTVPLEGTVDVQTGETTVTLSQDLLNALGSLQVQAEGFGEAEIQNGAVGFDITGGAADLDDTKVDLFHDDGLIFRRGEDTVEVTDFIISNLDKQSVLSGLVTVNDNLVTRASLFDLNVGNVVSLPEAGTLELQDVGISLTSNAAITLNDAFGVTSFTSGFNIGTADSVINLG
jgi:hypothetical protein